MADGSKRKRRQGNTARARYYAEHRAKRFAARLWGNDNDSKIKRF